MNSEQKYQQKLQKKYSSATRQKYKFADVKDMERLEEISKRQKEQIKRMTKDIQTLRSKVKPQDQFKLHEGLHCERSSPPILAIPGHSGSDDDLNMMRSQSLDTFSSKASNDLI